MRCMGGSSSCKATARTSRHAWRSSIACRLPVQQCSGASGWLGAQAYLLPAACHFFCSYRSTVDLVAHGNAGLVGPLLVR